MEITILPISQIKEIQHDISDMLRPLNNVEYLILKASINKYGLLSPVIVGEYNGKYILLDGSSRIHIYKEFVKTHIECVILPITGIDDAIRKSYIFNTARRNMSPLDTKKAYDAFREHFPLEKTIDKNITAKINITVQPAQTLKITAIDNTVRYKRPRTPAQLAHDQKMRDDAQTRKEAKDVKNNVPEVKSGVDRSQVQSTKAVAMEQKSQKSTIFSDTELERKTKDMHKAMELARNSASGEPVEQEWMPDNNKPFE